MAFKIKLAGIGFQVNGIYEESLKKHCGDYLDTEENSDNKKCFDNCVAGKEDLKLSDNDSVYEIIISCNNNEANVTSRLSNTVFF